jgi:hypothetical protein
MQYPSIILALEVPASKRLAAVHGGLRGSGSLPPVNRTGPPGEKGSRQ